jgi:uncharacterized protein with GYD domain
MPFYLTRFSYTPATWARLIKNLEDRREHDAYALYEAPDTVSIAAMALAINSGGALSSYQTIPLLTVEEALAAMRKAAEITYRPPGAGR